MLASSATENSDTQKQLLGVLGRTKTLHSLENYYQTTLTDYEVVIDNISVLYPILFTFKGIY